MQCLTENTAEWRKTQKPKPLKYISCLVNSFTMYSFATHSIIVLTKSHECVQTSNHYLSLIYATLWTLDRNNISPFNVKSWVALHRLWFLSSNYWIKSQLEFMLTYCELQGSWPLKRTRYLTSIVIQIITPAVVISKYSFLSYLLNNRYTYVINQIHQLFNEFGRKKKF